MATRKKTQNPFAIIRREFASDNYGLRQFRRDVAKLQKKGLVSKKNNPKEQTATRYMINQIRKFADVLNGTADTFEAPRNERAEYKESGYRTKGNRVIVPKPKGAKVKRSAPVDGHASYTEVRKSPSGTKQSRRVMVQWTSLEDMVRRMADEKQPLKKGEFYTIEYFGNSARTFRDLNVLVEEFMKYESVTDAIESGNIFEQEQVYRNFNIVTITNLGDWRAERNFRAEERRNANRQRYNEVRNAKNRERYKNMDDFEKQLRRERYLTPRREAEQRRRDRMKNDSDPAAYEEYKRKARERKARNKKQ